MVERILRISFVGITVALISGIAEAETVIISPNRQVEVKLVRHDAGLYLGIRFRGCTFIEESRLGFSVDGADVFSAWSPGKPAKYFLKETYATRGNHSAAVNRCSGARIPLTRPNSKTEYTLEVRAYDDGAAYRFVASGTDAPRTPDESTAFKLPAGSLLWHHDLRGHYEGVHVRQTAEELPAGTWIAPPLTFKLPEGRGYGSITESALVEYSGMAIQADGKRGFVTRLGHSHPVSYPFELRYGKEEGDRLSRPAAIAGNIYTPWRVIITASNLNGLVNSDIVTNLAPEPDKKLFPKGIAESWIKPGRAVWEYLDGKKSTLEEMKEYCRMAGELGFEYNVLEGFWRRWTDDQLRELVTYGRERGVGIWLWRHSRELRSPSEREAFFKKCADLGIVGVKIDFLDHEAKEVIDHYEVLLRSAAEHKLMVNFHGSNKPTGEVRTWPNELTREAVRGMESGRLENRAQHNVTLPFTRLLAGHADYTPVHFGARRGDTTWAHQIASAAILTSPLLTYGANPRNILANPAAEMMKRIPAVWDETIVLPPSEIGELAVFARRSGERWFLAVLNGAAVRTMRIPLSFLKNRRYELLIVLDGDAGPESLRVNRGTVVPSDSLEIELVPGGGYIAEYRPKR